MSPLVAAGASSHAFALEDPAGWNERRARNAGRYEQRFGRAPAGPGRLEAPEDLAVRAGRIQQALAQVAQRFARARPDVLILVGDDQDECFPDGNYPQLAMYLGGEFTARRVDRAAPPASRTGDAEFARAVYDDLVEHDVDLMALGHLPGKHLEAHAFGPLLEVIDPEARMAVVPMFVNAIHLPTPSPARCYTVGKLLRSAVGRHGKSRTVALFGSGGLSHYPASYPVLDAGPGERPFPWGHIDEAFDQRFMAAIRSGEGHAAAQLPAAALIASGAIELNSWLVVLGAVGASRPELCVYEALYSGMMGMGVCYWSLS